MNACDFNVLIGKNNSGKSNILAAIDAFFKCIGGLEVVALASPYRQEIDFYDRTLKPIGITLSFSLETAERTELLEDVVQEAPQGLGREASASQIPLRSNGRTPSAGSI